MANLTDNAEGRYMNFFQIGYNSLEFIFEFGHTLPEAPEVVHSRLIASPVCAKLLSAMLLNSIGQYETAFGAIPEADRDEMEGE